MDYSDGLLGGGRNGAGDGPLHPGMRRDHGPEGAGTAAQAGFQVTGDGHYRGRWVFLAQPLD